jgi:hypothetical protein
MESEAGPGTARPRRDRDLLPAGLALAAAIVAVLLAGDESVWTVWLLFAPVAVALLPLAASNTGTRRTLQVLAAVLLVCWCVAALFSVGILYVPAAVAAAWAAATGGR